MSGAVSPLPNTPLWRVAQLKHRDNFTFTVLILISVRQGDIVFSHCSLNLQSTCCCLFRNFGLNAIISSFLTFKRTSMLSVQ